MQHAENALKEEIIQYLRATTTILCIYILKRENTIELARYIFICCGKWTLWACISSRYSDNHDLPFSEANSTFGPMCLQARLRSRSSKGGEAY